MAFEIFKLGPKLFTDLATLDRIVREIIHDYAKFNTIYLELRTTPKDFEASTKEEYIDTLVKAMKEEEENNPRIKVRLLLSINRSQSLEAAKELVDLAIKFQSKGEKYIVGVEISGDPRQGQFSDFRAELQRARDSGLKTTLHCGET